MPATSAPGHVRQFLREKAPILVVAILAASMGIVVPSIFAAFNQATSGANTVSAQSAALQVADADQTTFAASVSGSLDKLTTNATGLQNDASFKLAGFVDLLHIAGDVAYTTYTLQNVANPAPTPNTNHAVLNDNLEVIVWESTPAGSGLASGASSPLSTACPTTQGRVGSGPMSPTIPRTAWKTLNAITLPLPTAGAAIRLCSYLGLATTTPASAAGGQVRYDLTFTATP